MTSAANGKAAVLQSHSKGWLFCILAALCLTACHAGQPVVQLAGASMGTTWHVTYIEDRGGIKQELLQAGIEQLLEEVEHSMSTYRDESEISRLNAAPTNTWFAVSARFYSVLSTALHIGRQSEGAYDVTVAPLVDLWGFGPGPQTVAPPSQQAIDSALAQVGQHKLRLDGDARAVMKLSSTTVDLSSIAKGFGVDLVAAWLLEQGVQRFLVEVGGEMKMSGNSGRGDPWRIAIERPDSAGQDVAAAISLTDVAIATSGDYRNYFEMDGRRYSHTIDPRTGYPVAHDLVSVTVAHPSAMLADAWATALTVLGAEQAMVTAHTLGLAVYFIRRVGDGFERSYTTAFAGYLQAAQQ